ncbi:MAG: ferrous iron transport protein B [Bacilli bacterium]|jgi:ferrous iron transport protein B|nr:ferrous iron transport protein B [Bacilli bacterium]
MSSENKHHNNHHHHDNHHDNNHHNKKNKNVVFLGNPNVGKSALINAMSNSKIKVGNWPGVTVDKLEANFTYKGCELLFTDLPGTYNFTNEHEAKITSEILLKGEYDLIVNVVDGTNLERNLNVTLLARELQKPMVLALNFDDDIVKSGLVIDTNKLERYLQMPVFRTSAKKQTGLNSLLDYIVEHDFSDHVDYNIYYDTDIDACVGEILDILKDDKIPEPSYGLKFLAYRLFEKEPHYTELIPENTLVKINQTINNAKFTLQESSASLLKNRRYDQIDNVLKHIVDKKGVSRYLATKKIDRIVLNKWLGLPILFLFTIYFLSLIFNVSAPFIDWIDGFINVYLNHHIGNLIANMPDWFQAMILDGLLAGVGGVLVFAPLMYFIYLLMGILEESGIMARIAFLLDRVMRFFGLNGKAFISMIIGFGCTVPAIASTRTLGSLRARKATSIMLNFVSCGARLPVYALFCAAFFSRQAGLVVASLYILGILVALIAALIVKKFGFFNDLEEDENFTIELPPYRIPEGKTLFKNVNNKLKGFFKRVITVIMVVLFAIWALSYFPNGKQEDSYLVKVTNFVQPVFKPTGFGESSEAIAALPTAIVAKEAVVGTIQTLSSVEVDDTVDSSQYTITGQLFDLLNATKEGVINIIPTNFLSLFEANTSDVDEGTLNAASHIFNGDDAKLKAYSYLVFILLLTPCAVAIATVRKEFGNKFMIQTIIITLLVPYITSTLIYQIGHLIFY